MIVSVGDTRAVSERLPNSQGKTQPRRGASRHLSLAHFWVCTLLWGLSGCQEVAQTAAEPELLVVPVSQPVQREVTDYVDFTGRTQSIGPTDIIARVTGYLVQMPFKEGADVKQGDLLFVIDPRPYKAQLDQAQGQVDLYKASLRLARTTLARDRAVNLLSPGSVSRQQFDQEEAVVDEAEARVKAFEKSMELYKLNHEFTRVAAPIDGQVGRKLHTLGNLVNQDQTLLTTIMAMDPMYAFFDMDEPTLLRLRKAVKQENAETSAAGTKMPFYMGLQGEDGFPHQGTINFLNNQVDPTTGSILVRGDFANPKLPGGDRLFSPGMFVRIRLPIGQPHKALLVIDRAGFTGQSTIGSDQGLKFVYVLDADNMVQQRRITTGSLQDDGLRVIESGLAPDDWVVVGGLQQVRLRLVVRPERVPMPSFAAQSTAAAPAEQPMGKDASRREPSKKASEREPGKSPSAPEPRKTESAPGLGKARATPPDRARAGASSESTPG
jgi:membrane fusion protein, multidrug efflux system